MGDSVRKKRRICRKTCDKPHYPYELPKGWCFTNIEELLINRDGERRPVSSAIRSKQKNKIYDYYGAAGIIDKVDDYLLTKDFYLLEKMALIYYQEVKTMLSLPMVNIG